MGRHKPALHLVYKSVARPADRLDLFDFEASQRNTPYRKQGTSRFDVPYHIKKRLQIQSSPKFAAAVEQLWGAMGLGPDDLMNKETYAKLHVRISRTLAPEMTPEEAAEALEEDWQEDCSHGSPSSDGTEALTLERLVKSMFGIADLWTNTDNELDYVIFINKLFRRITMLEGGKEGGKGLASSSSVGTLPPIRTGSRERPRTTAAAAAAAAAQPPGAPAAKWKSAHMLTFRVLRPLNAIVPLSDKWVGAPGVVAKVPKEAKGTPKVVNKDGSTDPNAPVLQPSHVVQAEAWTTTAGSPLRPAPVHIPSDEAEEASAPHRSLSIKLRSPAGWADGWRSFQHGGWVNTPRSRLRASGSAARLMSPHVEGGTQSDGEDDDGPSDDEGGRDAASDGEVEAASPRGGWRKPLYSTVTRRPLVLTPIKVCRPASSRRLVPGHGEGDAEHPLYPSTPTTAAERLKQSIGFVPRLKSGTASPEALKLREKVPELRGWLDGGRKRGGGLPPMSPVSPGELQRRVIRASEGYA